MQENKDTKESEVNPEDEVLVQMADELIAAYPQTQVSASVVQEEEPSKNCLTKLKSLLCALSRTSVVVDFHKIPPGNDLITFQVPRKDKFPAVYFMSSSVRKVKL
jgi:hypothetical protein